MFEWISIVLVFLLDVKSTVAQVFLGIGKAYLRQNQLSFGTQMKTALLNVSTIKVLWQPIWDTCKWELISMLYFWWGGNVWLQISSIPRDLKEAFSKKRIQANYVSINGAHPWSLSCTVSFLLLLEKDFKICPCGIKGNCLNYLTTFSTMLVIYTVITQNLQLNVIYLNCAQRQNLSLYLLYLI